MELKSDTQDRKIGLLPGLRLSGGDLENKITLKFSKHFLITFSRYQEFKYSNYVYAFLRPQESFKDRFNLYNEVLLLFSSYSNFDTRTLDFVDKTLYQFENRLDKICIIVVSKDHNIKSKIEKLNSENKDTRIIVPFTYKEILYSDFDEKELENKFRKYFYNRDLFALESPLKTQAYFFGRNALVQSFYSRYTLGQNAGLFGLRKTGKTSVLFALERMIALKEGYSIYIDCQDTRIHMSRWYELLYIILDSIRRKYGIAIDLGPKDEFSEKNSSELFKKYMGQMKKSLGDKRIIIMMDEIEHISFKTSTNEYWKKDMDYVHFWQTLRAIFQQDESLFSFIIAGVNPLCIEEPLIGTFDNPLFGILNPTYLELFNIKEVKEMVSNIGSYMGLNFDEEIYTDLTEHYGGHPFLIRHVCSLINKDASIERPFKVTKYSYRSKKDEYDKKIQSYVKLIISVLQNWYPNEYEYLETLAIEGSDKFKKIAIDSGIEHLTGYGIVKEDNGCYYIQINAIKQYITKSRIETGNTSTQEGKWQAISMRRNRLEVKLRGVILPIFKSEFGKDAKQELLKHASDKDKIDDLDLSTIVNDKLYFYDLSKIILGNWKLFQKIFHDKIKFELFSNHINKYRVDAHAKGLSEEDFSIVLVAFRWFEEKLEEL